MSSVATVIDHSAKRVALWVQLGQMPLAHLGALAPARLGIKVKSSQVVSMCNTRITALAPVRILVVDDFEHSRRWVCSKLGAHEQLQIVGEAVDGLDAIQKASELIPDLILMDIGLPDLNGIDAARRIGQLLPSTKIIFLTQNSDVDVVKAAMSNGARGYVLKGEAESELLPAIEEVFRGEKFVSVRLKERRRSGSVPHAPSL